MIAIKRLCEFFDHYQFADDKSRTCTQGAVGDYCGVFRTLSQLQTEKKKGEEKEK